MNWKYGFNFFEILSPFPVFASSRYFSNPHPHFVTQKRRYTSEPIGSSRLLTIKSSLSSTSLPPIRLRSLHILYPNTHGRLAIRIITPFTNAALFLLHRKNREPHSSQKYQVKKNKYPSTILACHIWKPPDITDSYCTSCTHKYKSKT